MIRAGRDVVWIVAAALALKAGVLLQLGSHPLLQPQGDLDTARYVDLARTLAAGGPLAVHEPFFLSPLYVYFLAVVISLGGTLLTARILQIVLGSAAVALVYLLARDRFGRRVGLLASALMLLTGFITFNEILILQSALDPVLVAAALFFVSRTQTTAARWPHLAAGISLGLFALNRPNSLVYGLAAVVLVGVAARRVRAAALVLLAMLAVLGANTLRNYLASGEPILISSHGGLNFYIGNNAEADGIYHPVPGVAPSMAGQVRDATRVAEAAEGRPLSRAQVSNYFYARAFEWIADNPMAALKLFGRKLVALLNRTDVPLNYSYAFYRRDESTLLRWLIVGPLLLVPLGIAGLFVAPRTLSIWTWASFVPIYALSVAAFFVADRYRMPLFIPLAVLSAWAIVWFSDAIRQRRFAQATLPIVLSALGATVAAWDLGLDDGLGGERARKAGWLIEQGSYEEARRYIADASEGLPNPGVFHFRVGRAYAAAGRYDDGVAELRRALAIDRGQPAIQLALGQALLLAGRPEDAADPLKRALEAGFRPEVTGPWFVRAVIASGRRADALQALSALSDAVVREAGPETALEMGTLALDLQAPAAAERWLRGAAARSPGSGDAQEKLGVALLLQGRPTEALAPIEQACRLAPANASARLNLAVAYAQLARYDEARAAAREAVRLDPSEPRAVALLQKLSKQAEIKANR